MSEALRGFFRFLEEGGYPISLSLLVLAVAVWAILLERLAFFGIAILPAARRQRASAAAAVEEAFSAYTASPRRDTREALVARCLGRATPLERLVSRALRGRPAASRRLQDLLLDRALVLGLMEVRQGLRALHSLGWAALLAGILAAIGGLQWSLQAMAEAGMTSEAAWASGISSALRGSELCVAVALPAILGGAWLSRRAAETSREIRLKRSLLGEALPQPWEAEP